MRLTRSIPALTFLIMLITASVSVANDYLIWDPCNSSSADTLADLLDNANYTGVVTDDIFAYLDYLDNYKPVFVFAEWWCDNLDWNVLDNTREEIYQYLLNGGSIYWQGENTAFCHDFYRDSLFMFDIATCATEPFEILEACDSGPFTVNLNIIPTYAEMIGWADGCAFEGEDLCWCKGVYRETLFRAILTTFPIAHLTDNGPNTRADFVSEIMGWLAPPMETPDKTAELPECYAVIEAYPNPFNAQTRIMYNLPVAGDVKIRIYNVLGQPVATLYDGYAGAGQHDITWDGESYSTGIYFARLENARYTECAKLILLK